MSVLLGLKIDVCTYDGLRVGVPNLLRLLGRHGVSASFFVALGPDTSGRAIVRALRPGFLAKMRRTRAVRTYGIRTILSGTLLPARHMGRSLAPILREVVGAGHELAIHGYDHRRWQDRLSRMDDRAVRQEVGRATALYQEIAGRAPKGFGAPGWQVSPASLRVLDELALAYASDTRGTRPFFPRVGGRTLLTLQLPTTFPTLDELLGLNGMDAPGFVTLLLQEVTRKAWSVLTLHAEMEGMEFQEVADRLLTRLGAAGVTCAPLEALSKRVREEEGDRIPAAEVVLRPIRGRAGTVAMPVGLEVT
jgi:peptidoglycan/xylan/chitin deacetylase (PgdA/CDA1 family)